MIRLNLLFHIQNLAVSQWSKRLKRVRMTNNLIQNVLHYCDTYVLRDKQNNVMIRRNGDGGLYYCLIARYAQWCRLHKGIIADGLPCYSCKEIIYDRQECISMAKSHGKKYFHEDCARKLNIIE